MGSLIYSFFVSLDGYIADEHGDFAWAEPNEEVHAFVNGIERSIGTNLYGRKLYELMAIWETPDALPEQSPAILEYARIWQAAEKIVFSRTLTTVTTSRTTMKRELDPAFVRDLKERSEKDISLGGPTLAAEVIRAGLVDEYHVFVVPVIIGGGNPFLPDRARADLELLDQRRFKNGIVYLRYGVRES